MLMPFNIYFTVVEAQILSCLQAVQVLRPLLVAVPPWSKTVMEPFTASRKMSKISYLYKALFYCLVGSYLMINIGKNYQFVRERVLIDRAFFFMRQAPLHLFPF